MDDDISQELNSTDSSIEFIEYSENEDNKFPSNQNPDIEILNLETSMTNEDISLLKINLDENRKYISSTFKNLINKQYSTCNICYNDFLSINKVITLRCSHYFHTKCIIPWIKKHLVCPCCRKDIK